MDVYLYITPESAHYSGILHVTGKALSNLQIKM